jgi:DNA invertase Pin-like site-specific DNA recombinase
MNNGASGNRVGPGHTYLQKLSVTFVSVVSPEAFLSDTPSAVLMRQMFGAISQFERAMVVAKLKGARDRKRRTRPSRPWSIA